MSKLEVTIKESIVNVYKCDSIKRAKDIANINSIPGDNKIFTYVTINPETNIENTIIIKRS